MHLAVQSPPRKTAQRKVASSPTRPARGAAAWPLPWTLGTLRNPELSFGFDKHRGRTHCDKRRTSEASCTSSCQFCAHKKRLKETLAVGQTKEKYNKSYKKVAFETLAEKVYRRFKRSLSIISNHVWGRTPKTRKGIEADVIAAHIIHKTN
jgi:hypothetical protein